MQTVEYKCECICTHYKTTTTTTNMRLVNWFYKYYIHTHTHWLYYKVSDEYAELGFLYIGERFLLRGPVVFVIPQFLHSVYETKHIFSFSLLFYLVCSVKCGRNSF